MSVGFCITFLGLSTPRYIEQTPCYNIVEFFATGHTIKIEIVNAFKSNDNNFKFHDRYGSKQRGILNIN
jgi:hypothetical protein